VLSPLRLRDRLSFRTKIADRPAVTLGSPLVRFAPSRLPPKRLPAQNESTGFSESGKDAHMPPVGELRKGAETRGEEHASITQGTLGLYGVRWQGAHLAYHLPATGAERTHRLPRVTEGR